MLNFLVQEEFRDKLIGGAIVGFGILYCINHKLSKQLKAKIKDVSEGKIYDFEEFINLQKDRMSNRSNSHTLSSNQKYNQSFLIRTTPQNSPFGSQETKIYSNQIYHCPPSQNLIEKEFLKTYHKQLKKEWLKIHQVFENKSNMFKGRILTDKISCQHIFQPRLRYICSDNAKKSIFQIIKEVIFQQIQVFIDLHEIVSYYLQKLLEKFYFNKNRIRAKSQKRSPLVKGVYAGLLVTQFNFLAGTNFLLKVQVEGNQISTSLIADNKLTMINFFQSKLIKQNMLKFWIGGWIVAGIAHLIYRHRLWFKIKCHNFTSRNLKQLNPKGISDDKLCQTCYFNCRNVLILKCRHLIICEDCYYHLDQKKCIICRENVQKKQILYSVDK